MASTMCSLMWEARKRQAWESTDGKNNPEGKDCFFNSI